jgi:acetyl-CoA carboxylase biotin carboxyl carrier protein
VTDAESTRAGEASEAGPGAATGTAQPHRELLALIDRLEAVLDASDLAEVEVAAGETALILRKPVAPVVAPTMAFPPAGGGRHGAQDADGGDAEGELEEGIASGLHAVLAPLTGIFYQSPAPEASPYVRIGSQVNVGQVIGLIEAMKLFNEIKSDVTGRVVRFAAENGALVKAKQPLIEVEPA